MSNFAILVNQASKIMPQLVKLGTNPAVKYIYLLNQKQGNLKKIHQKILQQLQKISKEKNISEYDVLDKLCYFNDLKRVEECQFVINMSLQATKLSIQKYPKDSSYQKVKQMLDYM